VCHFLVRGIWNSSGQAEIGLVVALSHREDSPDEVNAGILDQAMDVRANRGCLSRHETTSTNTFS
jgi:hypothetical protein